MFQAVRFGAVQAAWSADVGLPGNLPTSLADVETRIRAELEAQWDSLSGEAKRKACEELKAQFPDDASLQSVDCADAKLTQLTSAAGASAGVYLCASSGAGAVMAAGCGRVGAWLGKKFGAQLEDLNLRFGITGTITGGWGGMSDWNKFKWCFQTLPDPPYNEAGAFNNWPVMRQRFIDQHGQEAYELRCSNAFPGYVPDYTAAPAPDQLTTRERVRRSRKMGPAHRAPETRAYAPAPKRSYKPLLVVGGVAAGLGALWYFVKRG